jgi:hypothetical protein
MNKKCINLKDLIWKHFVLFDLDLLNLCHRLIFLRTWNCPIVNIRVHLYFNQIVSHIKPTVTETNHAAQKLFLSLVNLTQST